MNLIHDTRTFSDALDRLPRPAGVSHVYNPLAYMRRAHEQWLDQFVLVTAPSPRSYLILGMNPGPWGMVQTGVPFGDVANANIILGYRRGDQIPAPDPDRVVLHPKRPVQGFACTRREASGERLWGGLSKVWALATKPMPEDPTEDDGCPNDDTPVEMIRRVLADCFAVNYCPLAYLAADPQGTNVTPDAFRKSGPYRDLPYANDLDALCSSYIAAIMQAFRTRVVLAVGRYAETMAKVIVTSAMPAGVRPKVVYLTHPSPLATRSAGEWAAMAQREMSVAGILPEPRATRATEGAP